MAFHPTLFLARLQSKCICCIGQWKRTKRAIPGSHFSLTHSVLANCLAPEQEGSGPPLYWVQLGLPTNVYICDSSSNFQRHQLPPPLPPLLPPTEGLYHQHCYYGLSNDDFNVLDFLYPLDMLDSYLALVSQLECPGLHWLWLCKFALPYVMVPHSLTSIVPFNCQDILPLYSCT